MNYVCTLLFFVFWRFLYPIDAVFSLYNNVIGLVISCLLSWFVTTRCDWPKMYFSTSIISYFMYFLWIIKESLVASMRIIYLILWQPKEILSCINGLPLKLKNKSSQILFAQSVTMVPGTLTLDLEPNEVFTVHFLTLRDLKQMQQQNVIFDAVKKLETESK